jgi:hypothetical protein
MTAMLHYPNQSHQSGVDCPKYQPRADSKRCAHYLDGGACALASELMCVEWLKRNRRAVPQDPPSEGATPAQPAFLPGLAPPAPALPMPPATARATREPCISAAGAASVLQAEPVPARARTRAPISQEEIDSFKALGVELRLELDEVGPLWLVPRYTGLARKEITPEHTATLRLLLDAFPGARIAAFEKATLARTEEAQA